MWKAMWESVKTFFIGKWTNILLFLAVLVFGAILCKLLIVAIRKMFKRSKIEPTVGNFLVIVFKFLILLVYVLILCGILGIPVTSIVALVTAVSLAIGLAVQNSVSNLANGLVLLSSKPYKVGDFVDIGSTSGTVIELKLIHTVLLTPTNEKISIPHNTSVASAIKNYSTEANRRIDLKISVEYITDVEKVKEVLWEVVHNHDCVLQDMDNLVRLSSCAASSLDITLRAWVKTPDYWRTYFDLQEQILSALRENNIGIPYNTIDVNIKK